MSANGRSDKRFFKWKNLMEIKEIEKAKTAFDNKIERLYHYQPFNSEHITKLLKENTIYCSNPKNFNDPWDCKPWYDLSALEDPIEFQKIKDFFIEKYLGFSGVIPDLREAMIARLNNADRAYIENILIGWFSSSSESHANSFRIYCLTPYCTNALMWAHYAAKHTGICLEFDSTGRIFGGAWQVKYNDEFLGERFYQTDFDPMFQLLHKSDVWKYESEYRVISREPTGSPEYDESLLGSVNGIFKIPPGSLKSIIVGCAGPYQEVVDLVKGLCPEIQIKKAVRIPHRYTLEIE
jgi:hypothetical protein